MKKIIISSKNPVKINATLEGFKKAFPGEEFEIESVSVESNVSNQPRSEEETMEGALNRSNNAYLAKKDADYWVGIEGGVQEYKEGMLTFAWIYIKGDKLIGKGRSASFILPEKVADVVRQGKELGDADDIVFGKSNSKQQNGAVGILTGDIITRTALYVPAVILALVPFKNTTLY
ncbi:MAG: inosine/xanthosine triphosphatase [bacterium]